MTFIGTALSRPSTPLEHLSHVMGFPANASAYHLSMHRLLQYVGLTGYGTTKGRMPRRSVSEKRAIKAHVAAALAEYQKQQDSLKVRGLHFDKNHPILMGKKKGGEVQKGWTSCSSPSSAMEKVSPTGIVDQTSSTYQTAQLPVESLPKNDSAAPVWARNKEEEEEAGEEENTIFMSDEDDVEWKAFLRSFPPRERQAVVVKRTLSIALWTAHCKRLCLYCWAPRAMCVCPALQRYADQVRPQIWGIDKEERDTPVPTSVSAKANKKCFEAEAQETQKGECHSILVESASFQSLPLFRVSMLLHVEEVLRGTNTGHLAAFVLQAPILVWGVPYDDDGLRQLVPTTTVVARHMGVPASDRDEVTLIPREKQWTVEKEAHETSVASSSPLPFYPGGEERTPSDILLHWHHVCLYPSSNAKTFSSFLQEKTSSSSLSLSCDVKSREEMMDHPCVAAKDVGHLAPSNTSEEYAGVEVEAETTRDIATLSSSTTCSRVLPFHRDPSLSENPPMSFLSSPVTEEHRFHFILLDSTWGQALSLNRHVPSCIPRLTLGIDPDYKALFSALRKRTRLTGVSTLEAATFACEHSLRALGYPVKAKRTSTLLREVMMFYVNAKCILKSVGTPFQLPLEGLNYDSFHTGIAEASTMNTEAIDSVSPFDHSVENRGAFLSSSEKGNGAGNITLSPTEKWNTIDALSTYQQQHEAYQKAINIERYEAVQSCFHPEHGELRHLLPPPVLNYCYLCERVIGWHRMPEHVQGRSHRQLLSKLRSHNSYRKQKGNGSLGKSLPHMTDRTDEGSKEERKQETYHIMPSDFSSTVVVSSHFARPWRRCQ